MTPVTSYRPIHRPHHHQPQCTRILAIFGCVGWCVAGVCWCVRCCDPLILILMFPVNQARYAAAWPPATSHQSPACLKCSNMGDTLAYICLRGRSCLFSLSNLDPCLRCCLLLRVVTVGSRLAWHWTLDTAWAWGQETPDQS